MSINIPDQIGHFSMVLRIKRDDLGLISEAALVPVPAPYGRFPDRAQIELDPIETSKIVHNPHYTALAQLSPQRDCDGHRMGFLELGLPADGSEWWVCMQ